MGTSLLPMITVSSQGSSDPLLLGKDTEYWAYIVGVGEYAENRRKIDRICSQKSTILKIFSCSRLGGLKITSK